MNDQLLTTGAAARILSVDPGTIRLWERQGRLPVAHRTSTGLRLFAREMVEQLAAERAEPPQHSGAGTR